MGYSSTQKGYKCYHPPTKRFFVTADVTFEEGTPYFTQPYLQGEQSLVGDKDRDNFLLEQQPLPMLVLPTQSTQTQSQNQSQHQSHHQSTQTQTQHQSHPIESHSQPNQSQFQPIQPQSQPVFDTWRYEQVYSRGRVPNPEPEQVQDSSSTSGNEVSTTSEPISEIDDDLYLLITLRKNLKNVLNTLYIQS